MRGAYTLTSWITNVHMTETADTHLHLFIENTYVCLNFCKLRITDYQL